MGTLPPTPILGLVLPDPGTAQPFSTAVQNGWFQTLDTAFGVDRNRLGALEPLVLASGANPGVIPAGTTAQRDAFWGIPAAGAPGLAARLNLANKGARWFNTDKGYQERYFSATADASAVPLLSRATAGWKPEGAGLIPISPSASANLGTGGTLIGNELTIVNATVPNVSGCFTDDFDTYKIFFDFTLTGPAGLILIYLRVGAADFGAGTYSYQGLAGNGGTVGAGALNGTTGWPLDNIAVLDRLEGEITLSRPAQASPKAMHVTSFGVNASSLINSIMGGYSNLASAADGFRLQVSSVATLSGTMKIYGLGGSA